MSTHAPGKFSLPFFALSVGCSLLGWGLAAPSPAHAQISLDGSLGPKGAINPVGSTYNIQSTYGKTVGSNLFQSFDQFNIGTGQTATFSAPAGSGILNVISRVTGGSSSSIDGTLQSTIPGADVYLINPSGVVFGPNAKLSVPGSFAATTADHVTLKDGNRFSASQPSTSVLTSAPPSAFGFLPRTAGSVPKAIAVNGSSLAVPAGKQLSLVGGNVTVQAATLSAPAGRINVVSAASGGEATFNPADNGVLVDTSSFTSLGSVAISQASSLSTSDGGTTVDAQGFGGGSVVIRAGQFSLDGSSILSQPGGAAAGRFVDIGVTGSMTMTDDAVINATSLGAGAAGAVRINAGSLTIEGSGPTTTLFSDGIFTATTAGGAGGDITITAGSATVANGAQIFASTGGTGAAGNITLNLSGGLTVNDASFTSDTFTGAPGGLIKITAGDVSMTNASVIGTRAESTGNAGAIQITAKSLDLLSGSHLDSRALSTAAPSGAGGDITLAITGALTVNDGAIASYTSGGGDAGNVKITAGSVALSNDGIVLADTTGSGNAGTIQVDTPGSLTITGSLTIADSQSGLNVSSTGTAASGDAGHILVHAGTLTVSNDGLIDAETDSTGAGGQISLTVDGTLQFLAGGTVFISSGASGAGGKLNVQTPTLLLSGENKNGTATQRSSIGITSAGAGAAGTATLNVGTLTMTDDSIIDASSSGAGKGGELTVNASKGVNVLSGGFIISDATSSGLGGDVNISAPELTVSGQANNLFSQISANAGTPDSLTGTGHAGRLNLQLGTLTIGNFGTVSSDSYNHGAGGDVTIHATGDVSVHGTISASAENTSTGASGTVTLGAHNLTLDGAGTGPEAGHGVIRTLTPDAAKGGDIVLTLSGSLTVTNGGAVDASTSGVGAGGSVRIASPNVSVSEKGEILSNTAGSGSGGSVVVNTSGGLVQLTSGGVINADNASGAGGSVSISTGVLNVSGSVGSDDSNVAAFGDGAGKAGDVTINAQSILVNDNAYLSSSAFGQGDGGSVTINAPGGGLQLLSGGQIDAFATNANGGTITVTTAKVMVSGSAQFSSSISAFSEGAGAGGDIVVNAPSVNVATTASISSDAASTGNGGSVKINAQGGSVQVLSGGSVHAFGTDGKGGTVAISTGDLTVSGFDPVSGGVSVVSAASLGTGKGGDVILNATNVAVNQSASISSDAARSGNGGDVTINATGVNVTQQGAISSDSDGVGDAGDVRVAASSVNIDSGGFISSNAESTGDGGSVTINAGQLSIHGVPSGAGNTGLLATSYLGNAGTITVSASRGIDLVQHGTISTSAELGGGDIVLNLGSGTYLTALDSRISAESFGAGTKGGSVIIRGGDAIVLADSIIRANSPSQLGGNIDVKTTYFFGNAAGDLGVPVTYNEVGFPNLLFASARTGNQIPVTNSVIAASIQQLTSRRPSLIVAQYPASAAQKTEAANAARAYVARQTGQAPPAPKHQPKPEPTPAPETAATPRAIRKKTAAEEPPPPPAPSRKLARREEPPPAAAPRTTRTAPMPQIIAVSVTPKAGSTAASAVVFIDVNTRQLARPDVYEITTKPDEGEQLTIGGISAPFVGRGGSATANP